MTGYSIVYTTKLSKNPPQRRFCLGFFGMIRIPITCEDFLNFVRLLPANSTVDVFITCCDRPTEMDENIKLELDNFTNIVNNIFAGCQVYIQMYSYEPQIYIKRTQKLNYAQYGKVTRMHPYRIMSFHHCLSLLAKNITDHIERTNVNYDNVILTRFDMLQRISSLGKMCEAKNTENFYIYRNPQLYGPETVEDRMIVLSSKCVGKLQGLYESHETMNLHQDDFWSENILKEYVKQFHDVNMVVQEGVQMDFSPFKEVKYENFFLELQERFIQNILLKFD